MNKKVAAGVAAVILAASVGANRAFEPSELVHSAEYLARHTQHAPVRLAGEDPLAQLEDYERISLPDAVRAWFIRLPVAVKSTLLLPLWALGVIPAELLTALGPVWGAVLGFLAQMAVLAGLFCLVYKLLFPHKKLRELFRKKNLKWLLLAAVTLTAANVLLAQLWTGWPLLRTVLLAGVGALVLGLLWKRLCGMFQAPEPDVVHTRLMLDY